MKERLPSRWRKIVVATSGGSVIILGIIALPAPGPGWLIIFAGLSILSREFTWAAGVLSYGREKYSRWEEWLRRQSSFLKSLLSIGFAVTMVALLWLWNVLYLVASFVGIEYEWLQSPLFK